MTNWTNPVVFFANGIGDAVLALPAVRALTTRLPLAVTLITRGDAPYLPLLQPLPFRRIMCINKGTRDVWEPDEIRAVTTQVGRCDLFVGLTPWQSASLRELRRALRPSFSVGFDVDYDVHIPPGVDRHSSLLMFDLVTRAINGAHFGDFCGPPELPAASCDFAQRLRAACQGMKLLVIHGDTSQEKMWTPARWSATVRRFLARHEDYVALSAGSRSAAFEYGVGFAQTQEQIPLTLCDSMAVVQQADVFVGVDSCMLHVADLSAVPSVALFGPTPASHFGPIVGPHVTLQAQTSMDLITPESVLDALDSIVASPFTRETRLIASSS